MNKLVSGAIGVSIEITSNRIFLPDILDLKGKRIKHIDFCDKVNVDADGNICITATGKSAYLNILEQNTQDIKTKDLSLEMLRLSNNNGNRLFINKIIDFPHSYIEWKGTPEPGKFLFFVFWFDEPKIMNRVIETGRTAIDSFEVITTSSTNKKYFFGENRTLYNKMFQNIMFYNPAFQGVTPKGNTSVNGLSSKYTFLTLQKDSYQYLRNIPLYVFDQQNTDYPIRLQNVIFDFTNSFIQVSPAYDITPGESWLFNVEFDDNN